LCSLWQPRKGPHDQCRLLCDASFFVEPRSYSRICARKECDDSSRRVAFSWPLFCRRSPLEFLQGFRSEIEIKKLNFPLWTTWTTSFVQLQQRRCSQGQPTTASYPYAVTTGPKALQEVRMEYERTKGQTLRPPRLRQKSGSSQSRTVFLLPPFSADRPGRPESSRLPGRVEPAPIPARPQPNRSAAGQKTREPFSLRPGSQNPPVCDHD
jgi:hypothetical protein